MCATQFGVPVFCLIIINNYYYYSYKFLVQKTKQIPYSATVKQFLLRGDSKELLSVRSTWWW